MATMKYKVGDKVRIRNNRGSGWNIDGLMDKYCGKVMTIRSIGKWDGLISMEEDRKENHGYGWCWDVTDIDELVERKARPTGNKKPSKYYNGKVVCVMSENPNDFTVGKVYTFENGRVVDNNGKVRYKGIEITDLSEIKTLRKFIPFVE